MLWEIIKILIGMYIAMCIAGKNPEIGIKIYDFHRATIAWAYMWLPKLVMWIYNKIKEWRSE